MQGMHDRKIGSTLICFVMKLSFIWVDIWTLRWTGTGLQKIPCWFVKWWSGKCRWYSDSQRGGQSKVQNLVRARLLDLSITTLGYTQLRVQWVPYLFQGVKAARVCNWQPTPSVMEVKERVELAYTHTHTRPSWPVVTGWGLLLCFCSWNAGAW